VERFHVGGCNETGIRLRQLPRPPPPWAAVPILRQGLLVRCSVRGDANAARPTPPRRRGHAMAPPSPALHARDARGQQMSSVRACSATRRPTWRGDPRRGANRRRAHRQGSASVLEAWTNTTQNAPIGNANFSSEIIDHAALDRSPPDAGPDDRGRPVFDARSGWRCPISTTAAEPWTPAAQSRPAAAATGPQAM
jgi:hypothetical protein